MSNRTYKDFQEIEQERELEKVVYDGVQIWPMLRNYIVPRVVLTSYKPITVSTGTLKRVLRYVFYGFRNWFAKYDYLVISSSDQRKLVDGKYVARTDYIDDSFGNALHIELPNPRHERRSGVKSPHIVSKIPLYLISQLFVIFWNKRNLSHAGIIDKVLEDLNISFNYDTYLKRFDGDRKMARWLLNRYNPKFILLTTSYTNTGLISICRERNIPVIEFQHGLINKNHAAYSVNKTYDRKIYPNYLLTYGQQEVKLFEESSFIESSHVIPVGHFYLDILAAKEATDPEVQKLRNKYQRVICVSGQDPLKDKIIPFLQNAAVLSPSTCFLYVPRNDTKKDYPSSTFKDNLIYCDWLNVYEAIMNADAHSTLHSTTAIEAPALGKPNILMNIDGGARFYLGDTLVDESVTRYADTAKDMVEIIDAWPFYDSAEDIKAANSHCFVQGYRENVNKALKTILKDV